MKKNIIKIAGTAGLLLLVSLAVAGSLFARGWGKGCNYEGRGEYGNRAESRIEFLKEKLSLSDSQVDTLFDIDAKYRRLFYLNRGNPEKNDEIRDKKHEEIKSMLSDEQKKIFDNLRENNRGERPCWRR